MKYLLLLAVIGTIALGGGVGAQDKKTDKPTKDDLPYTDTLSWDVKLVEGDPTALVIVKRTTTKAEVVWVLEPKTDDAALALYNGSGIRGYHASFHDEDGVRIAQVYFEWQGNFKKDERVRATLKMPAEEVIKKTTTIKLLPK